jgi:hypothetical protein
VERRERKERKGRRERREGELEGMARGVPTDRPQGGSGSSGLLALTID